MLRLLAIPLAMIALLAGEVIWSGGAARHRADFVFINRGEIGTLDLKDMSWLQDIRIAYAVWEGLYTLDPVTLDPIPGAAERIDISPDKKVYTFHIRREARWHDGSPVTPADFIFSWKRSLEEPGDYTYLIATYVRGARQYQDDFEKRGRKLFSDVGIEALDEHTLRVSLEDPLPFFPELCAFPAFFPMHEPSMRKFAQPADEKTGRVSYDTNFIRPPNLIGNGPYRLSAWEFKKRTRLDASEFYWNRASVRSKAIEMVSTSDPQWSFLTYDRGGVDWLSDVSADLAAELRAKGRKDLHIFPGFGTYFYSINCRKPPLNDPRVRRALSLAIDREGIVRNITRLGEPVASSFTPPNVFPDYRLPRGLLLNIDEARKLLADAGFPGGRGFPKMSILYNAEGSHADIAQFIARQWQHNLGIQMETETVEIKSFRQRLHKKEYDIARASWYGDYMDVSTFTDKYLSDSENNDSDWKNKQYDQLCEQARKQPDAKKRLDLLSQAEQILINEQPIIPLYHYVNCYLFRDNVTGLPLNVRVMLMFNSVHVQR